MCAVSPRPPLESWQMQILGETLKFLGAFVEPLKDIISAVSQFLPSQV